MKAKDNRSDPQGGSSTQQGGQQGAGSQQEAYSPARARPMRRCGCRRWRFANRAENCMSSQTSQA